MVSASTVVGILGSTLNVEAQTAGGVYPDMLRLSVGLEHPDDIKEDLDQAFARL